MMADHQVLIRPVADGDWYRRLHGPFHAYIHNGVRVSRLGPDHLDVWLRTSVVVAGFSQPQAGTWAAIVDSNGWCAYGYTAEVQWLEKYGHPIWFGCELGFAVLEAMGLVDPVELAMRESIARSQQTDWWKEGT